MEQFDPNYAVHPGETLREKLDEINMTPAKLAAAADLPVGTVIAILFSVAPITEEIAKKLEHAINIPAQFWLKKQQNYDEYKTKRD